MPPKTRAKARPTSATQPAAVATTGESRKSMIDLALAVLVCAAALLVPLYVSHTDIDAFRLPKEMLYESLAIFTLAVLLIALLFKAREVIATLAPLRVPLLLGAAIVSWTAIATLTSTNRVLSVRSLLWVASVAVLFAATLYVARRTRGLWLAGIIFVPAVVNAILAILQRADVYNPMTFPDWFPIRLRVTAFIGNPNDVGTYLMFPTIAAIAIAMSTKHAVYRLATIILGAILGAGILATETITSVIGIFAAVGALLIVRYGRRALPPLLAFFVAGAIVIFAFAPLRTRVTEKVSQFRRGEYIEMSSLRVPAYFAAWRIFRDHPMMGAGPGTFGWWYLPYKMQLNKEQPRFYITRESFGEAHNDHLQTLAVAGIPGYLLFLAAVGALAWQSRRRKPEVIDDVAIADIDDPRPEIARLTALPLSVAFSVVALAQFPLELAPVAGVLLHLCALCCAWRTVE